MLSRVYIIKDPQGLHARPSAQLLKLAQSYGCRLFVKNNGAWQEAGIMNMLLQLAGSGAQVELAVDGGREEECLVEMGRVIEKE